CGRYDTHHSSRARQVRQIGMALETDVLHSLARQHPGIRRPVQLVTTPTAPEPHHRVLEREWAAFVAVALEAAGLVGREKLHHSGPHAAMRIVAVHTGHGAFGKAVMVRFLKLAPGAGMAACALRIDRRGCPLNKAGGTIGMNLVAARTSHLV